MCQNIMSAANDLRPVQARYNLEAMMTRQLEIRREETASFHKFVSLTLSNAFVDNDPQKM